MTDAAPAVPAGLCALCRHRRIVRNGRGSQFSLCRRAGWDPALTKYPRLPVLDCHGHESALVEALDGASVGDDG